MQKKIFLTMLIVSTAVSVAIGLVNVRYPFAKNLTITPVGISGNSVTLAGSVDIQFTKKAWEDFGYKEGNFLYFNQWWQEQEGKTFSYDGITVKLKSIEWNLVEHFNDHDHLTFRIQLQLVSVLT